ncbi:MAG: tRNA preQ1(34) S-adenosylmethionine ribosyltransferase-isomerase QueA [Rhodomicrobium sp.]
MLIKNFDFELPKTAIALRPACPRDSARLLIVERRSRDPFSEAQILDLPAFLRPGDVIVFNNTKVLPAEVVGHRPSRDSDAPAVEISLTFIEHLSDGTWKALARPARRLRAGDRIVLGRHGEQSAVEVTGRGPEGEVTIAAADGLSIERIMQRHGAMPLPPYIARARAADKQDMDDYQTVYAKEDGAVAAPTAGLHFTPALIERLTAKGVRTEFVTLHVGAGTFLPVKTERVEDHHIHAEPCEISAETAANINHCRERGGRLIAVGTTSLRLLETAALEDGSIAPYRGSTSLFIKPGHRFRSADFLLTNFHLPKSTLFMLVCAFSGTALMKMAYAHAIAAGFRFYSYGDACLLQRAESEMA